MAGRSRVPPGLAWPVRRKAQLWSERWQAPEQRLKSLESTIRDEGAILAHGSAYDRWDLEVRGGLLAAVRLLMTVEEHGAGRQMFRFHLTPRYTPAALVAFLPPALLAVAAALDQAWAVSVILSVIFAFLAAYSFFECASATAVLLRALRREGADRPIQADQPVTGAVAVPSPPSS